MRVVPVLMSAHTGLNAGSDSIKGKRFRKTFKTKGEAQRFEATCRAKVVDNLGWSPTGACWSEAEKLKPTGLRNAVITFSGTKSGKVRSVPITAALEARIRQNWKQHGQPNAAITSFRRALAKKTIQLPRGQAAHSLRHTLASHFIQSGGNILTLQKILGHSSLAMTMRYAHLAPEHLAAALSLGPQLGVFLV